MSAIVWTPDNPALERVLANLPAPLDRHVEHARYLLWLVCGDHWQHHDSLGGFTRLRSDILRQYIPARMLAPLVRHLTEAGVIETAPYSVGHFSKGYRISPTFDGLPRRAALTDRTLCRKIAAYRAAPTKPCDPAPPEVLARRAGIRAQQRRTLDRLGFLQPFEQVISEVVACGGREGHARYVCDAILCRQHEGVRVCRFGYRCHSILTRAHSEIRRRLALDGEPLAEWDVATSQPLLLWALLTEPDRWTTYVDAHDISSERHNGGAPPPLPAACCAVAPEELREWEALCATGKLYNVLEELGGFPDRNTAKARFFPVLCGRRQRRPSIMARAWAVRWPTCWAAVEAIKAAWGHRSVSQALQRFESEIVIDGACARFVRELAGADLLTVHDSLLVRREHAEAAREMLAGAFDGYGIRAMIRRKDSPTPTRRRAHGPDRRAKGTDRERNRRLPRPVSPAQSRRGKKTKKALDRNPK